MTEKDVFIASCGIDEDRNNKSIIKIETKYIDVITNQEISDREVTIDGPIINIYRSMQFTQVDLCFKGSTEYDFVNAASLLSKFTTPENSLDSEAKKIPVIQLTIMPKSLRGEYYICGIYPAFWGLVASEAGGEVNTIKFAFANDSFQTYRINDADVDGNGVESDLYNDAIGGAV